jgi:ribosomal protein S12 methylthiotransferase
MRFVEEMQFDRLGVFLYSKEEGTAAAKMKEQIKAKDKKKRRDEIMKLQQQIAFEKAQKMVGCKLEVLIEGKAVDEDVYVARTYRDAPDVDGFFFLQTKSTFLSGDLVEAIVTGFHEYDLIGIVVGEETDESAE